MAEMQKILRNTNMKYYLKTVILLGWAVCAVQLMHFPDNPVLIFGLWILATVLMQKSGERGSGYPKEVRLWGGIFATALSLCTWVGSRIVIGDGGNYSGLWTQNYMAAFSGLDYLRLIFLWTGNVIFFCNILLLLSRRPSAETAEPITDNNRMRKKIWLISTAVIFLCWLPYALANYPGLIFGDSLWSIREAVGLDAYSNHYPIMYTLFIKFWLKIGHLFGNTNLGCFFYTLIQMLIVSAVFGYTIRWISRKNVPNFWLAVITAAYALMPIFPLHAISMWKDPLFSVGLLLMMLLLYDIVASGGRLLADRRTLVKFLILTLWICFSRNNGLYVMLLINLVLIIQYAIRKRHRAETKPLKFVTVLVASVLGVLIVTGPVYKALGIGNPLVESVGIPLQQMASVVVHKGNMSENDKAFLNNLMPEKEYSKVFTPCCVDNLKWDPKFHGDYLSSHKMEFIRTYFSLFYKNIGIYSTEWAMQTYGFWTPNNLQSSFYSQSLAPLQYDKTLGLEQKDLFLSTFGFSMQSRLGVTFQFLCSSALTWILFFVAALLCTLRKKRCLIALLPPFGVLLTLLVSTPLADWLRYVLVDVYALPLILLLPWIAKRADVQTEQHINPVLSPEKGKE